MKIEIELPEREGFEYTGEYRKPNVYEWGYCWLNDKIFQADNCKEDYRLCHILKKIEPTLEEKVKAKYPDYEVVMLIKSGSFWGLWRNPHGPFQPHVMAPSLTGFYRYVYQHLNGDWDTICNPTMNWDKNVTLLPIAVLFKRDK